MTVGIERAFNVTGLQIIRKYVASNYEAVKSKADIITAISVWTGLHKQKEKKALQK